MATSSTLRYPTPAKLSAPADTAIQTSGRRANTTKSRQFHGPSVIPSGVQISKHKLSHSRQDIRKGMAVNSFEKQMHTYTSNLIHQFEQDLEATEEVLYNDLDSLCLRLGGKCRALERANTFFQSSLADEYVEILDPDDSQKQKNVLLQERVQVFRRYVEEKTELLDKLWIKWTDVQNKLLCLAVEIYGDEVLCLDDAEVSTNLRIALREAASRRAESIRLSDLTKGTLSDLEVKAEQISTETERSLDAQLKVIRDGHKQKVRNVMAALAAFK